MKVERSERIIIQRRTLIPLILQVPLGKQDNRLEAQIKVSILIKLAQNTLSSFPWQPWFHHRY